MRNLFIYLLCSISIAVAFILVCAGGWWSLVGLCLCGMLYISVEAFPNAWKMFWLSNMKVLKFFKCL